MLSVAHGLIGAYVASLFPEQPLIYLPVAIGLHFVADAVPHWDVGTGLSTGKKSVFQAYSNEIIDLAFTFGLVFILWQKEIPTSWDQVNWPIWLGALAGLLIDFLEFPCSALGWNNIPGLKQVQKVHHWAHRSTTKKFFGLFPQVLVIGVIIILTLKK